MFPPRRPARQILATVFLLVCCVAPTAWVAIQAWRVHQPGFVRETEAQLATALGLRATLASVAHPGPGETEFTQLTLHATESPASQARLLEFIRFPRLRARQEADTTTLHTEELTLNANSIEDLSRRLGELSVRLLSNQRRVQLLSTSAQLVLNPAEDPQIIVINDLALVCSREGGGPKVSASFRVVPAVCELVWTRTQGERGPIERVEFQTFDRPVPVKSLPFPVDLAHWFGTSASLSGTWTFHSVHGQPWSAQFTGEVHDVDLARLVRDRFPDIRLTGLGALRIDSADWGPLPNGQGHGWARAQGVLQARAGVIGLALVESMARELKFRAPISKAMLADPIPYARLGVAFTLNEAGELLLNGALGEQPGSELVAIDPQDVPLLLAPTGVASVRGLWKTLFPSGSEVLVPVTPQTHVLRYLPVPLQEPPSLKAN